MKFLPYPLNVNYTVLQRRVRTKVFCQIREETKQIFWSISTRGGTPLTRTLFSPLSWYRSHFLAMFGENDCLGVESVVECVLKFTLLELLADLICSLLPSDDDKLFIARAPTTVTPIHPPIVPTEWWGCRQNRVLFCLSTGKKGGLEGREWGVLWRRNAIHIMSGTLTFQRSRNACKPQTSGKMWTPGTWQLTPINSEIRAGKCGIRNPTHNLSGTFQRTGNANQLRRSTQSYQNQNLEAITNRISIMFGRSIFHRSGNAKWWVKNAPLASQEKCKPLVGKADPPKH